MLTAVFIAIVLAALVGLAFRFFAATYAPLAALVTFIVVLLIDLGVL